LGIENSGEDFERLAPSRRTLLKAAAAAGAFAVPLIASFSMDAPAMASERTPGPPNTSNVTEYTYCTNASEHEYCSNVTEHHHHHHHHHHRHHRHHRPWWWFWSQQP